MKWYDNYICMFFWLYYMVFGCVCMGEIKLILFSLHSYKKNKNNKQKPKLWEYTCIFGLSFCRQSGQHYMDYQLPLGTGIYPLLAKSGSLLVEPGSLVWSPPLMNVWSFPIFLGFHDKCFMGSIMTSVQMTIDCEGGFSVAEMHFG